MTTISVIVTARDAQGHLRECLDSVLAAPAAGGPGIEVICVGTGADDGTRPVMDEYAAADPRVTLVAPDRPLAAGPALDAGARAARGTHLLFLEARDRLVPGALAALAHRAAETGDPDLVLFDHVRVHWRNPPAGSSDGRLFAGPGRAVVSTRTHHELLALNPVMANRLVRAAFLERHRDLLTEPGAGEVLPAMGLLLAAERVAVLDEVLLRRTEPDHGTTGEDPFALFPTHERLAVLLDSLEARPEQRLLVFNALTRRMLRVLDGDTLDDAAHAEYFRLAAARFTRHRPAGYRRPADLNGVRHALLERGSHAAYRAFRAADRRRRGVRSLAVRARRRTADLVNDGVYREQLRHPVEEDLAVFSAYWDRGVACSPGAISAELARRAPHIRQVWVVRKRDVPLLPPGTDHVVPGSRRYWSVMARAKYFVNNVNFPDSLVKRTGQIHVQTHHGTPLKRMGIDQIPFPATSRGVDYDALLERCARWDYSVSANPHSTETWERAYPVPFTSLDYGYPRNDVYCTATAADVARVRDRLGIAPGRTAVLYAPTHRDYEAGWTPRLDLARLARVLGEDFVLLVRGHYFYDRGASPLEDLHRRGLIIDVSAYDSVEELGLASDALITDYSSVMFDYANLDRPIVVYADDWETYAVTRGVYFDLTEGAPGPVATDQDALETLFIGGGWRDQRAAQRRAAFRRRFCAFDDGHAAERVVNHVFLGRPGTPAIVPLDRRTPAPAPQRPPAPAADPVSPLR